MKLTTPGRLAAAPRGGTEPDRATRIGFGTLLSAAPPGRLRRPVPEGNAFHATRVPFGAMDN